MNRTAIPATRARWIERASPFVSPPLRRAAAPALLFLLALVSQFLYDPLHRPLYQDPGIFAFLSQLVAQGFMPHQMAFNEQSSLTFFFGGAAMRFGDLFGVHHLISFRIASMLVASGVVVLTYVAGKVFSRSERVGLLAGLIMLGFQGYLLRAATALEPKSFMLVFGLTTLYLLSERRWFWAGVSAGAAGLAWQIGWGYLAVALVLAFAQGGRSAAERGRAFLLTLGAALGVFGVYFAYFAARNAHVEMLQQTFLAPVVMHNVQVRPWDERLVKLARTFHKGFGAHWIYGVLGASGLVVWLAAQARAKGWHAVEALFQDSRTAGTLLVTLGFVVYSLLDFQNYPDWIPLLPFISIFAALFIATVFRFVTERARVPAQVRGAGWVALALVLLAFSVTQTANGVQNRMRNSWQDQQRVADEINQQIPRDAPIWLLGKAELLFFTQRHNLNKYIYLLGRVDAAAEEFEPGGFDTMFKNAQNQKPVLYALGRFKPGKFSKREHYEVVNHSTRAYTHLERCRVLGSGAFFTQPELAHALFPADSKHCLKLK